MNLKRILNVVGALLLIALVVPFVIYAVPMTVGADHSFVVLTASMTPAIAPGDVVIVADRDPATIAEGDVITFTRPGNDVPVTHRVTTVAESGGGLAFETKGDANSDPDASLVPAENVVGLVILTIPYIGYVIQFTNTPYGFVALVVGPIGLFIASELWTLYRQQSATASSGDEPTETVASEDSADGTDRSEETERADQTGGFVITSRTLEGALVPLLALALYSGYVATVRLTEVTIAVAVGSAISTLALVVLLVSASRETGKDEETTIAESETDSTESENGRPAADGGVEWDFPETISPSDSDDGRTDE